MRVSLIKYAVKVIVSITYSFSTNWRKSVKNCYKTNYVIDSYWENSSRIPIPGGPGCNQCIIINILQCYSYITSTILRILETKSLDICQIHCDCAHIYCFSLHTKYIYYQHCFLQWNQKAHFWHLWP